MADWFDEHRFWTSRYSFDLYFAGVVKGAAPSRPSGRLPRARDIEKIDEIMTLTDRVIRLPLRAVRVFVRNEDLYQRLVLRYWERIHKLRQTGCTCPG